MRSPHLLAILGASCVVVSAGCYSIRSDDDDDTTTHGDPCEVFEDDVDGDGWGDCSDCDDSDIYVNPGMGSDGGCCEQDGRDNDCDGRVDEDEILCDIDCNERDDDLDGWPEGNDCDDSDPAVHPEAFENVCCRGDGRDNDCDGAIDEQDTDPACRCDLDEDGDGWPAIDDCDDADPAQSPGQNEYCCPCGSSDPDDGGFPYPQCNGEDDDCDGVIDETSNLQEEDEFCCSYG